MKRIVVVARRVGATNGSARIIVEQMLDRLAYGHVVELRAEHIDTATQSLLASHGARFRTIPRLPLFKNLRRDFFARRAVKGLVGCGGPDLVIGHGDAYEQDILVLHNCVHKTYEKIHGAPLPASDATGRFHAKMLASDRARLVIANSFLMRDDLIARYRLAPDKIQVIHPAFDAKIFAPTPSAAAQRDGRIALGLPTDRFIVGFITSGDFAKRGLDIGIRALCQLPPTEQRNVRLLVVGSDRQAPRYAALKEELGGFFDLEFRRPTRDVASLFRALDLYIHPAHFEEFGLTVLEALASGVPTVTSKCVGASEVFPAGYDSVVEVSRADAIAAEILSLVGDSARRQRLARLGVEACRDLTWERYRKAFSASCAPFL